MVSGLFEKKRDAIPPHPAPPQALGYIFEQLLIGHSSCFSYQLLPVLILEQLYYPVVEWLLETHTI
jgi:hypothetical protein